MLRRKGAKTQRELRIGRVLAACDQAASCSVSL